jgi:hypothetical protein
LRRKSFDRNIWHDEENAVNITRVKIKALLRKRDSVGKPIGFWVASKEILEIWSLNVRCNNYNRYLTVWSKVTLGYALDIWNERTKRFSKCDWILYNNKRLKNCDIREDIINYRNSGCIYLRTAIKGGGKINPRAFEMNEHWGKYITEAVNSHREIALNVSQNEKDSSNWVKPFEYFNWESLRRHSQEVVVNYRKMMYEALYGEKYYKCRNDLIIFILIEDRKAFYETRIVATHLMFKIEKKMIKLYPVDMEKEREKQLEICSNEADILCEKDEMKLINDLYKWRWQIRGLRKEAKARNLIKKGKSVSSKLFDDCRVRRSIKEYKEGIGRFKAMTDAVKGSGKDWVDKCKKILRQEYDDYYKTKMYAREKGGVPYNRIEIYGLIRNAVYPRRNCKMK